MFPGKFFNTSRLQSGKARRGEASTLIVNARLNWTAIDEGNNYHNVDQQVTGAKDTPSEFNNDVMNMLKEHAKNNDREQRINLPDLN